MMATLQELWEIQSNTNSGSQILLNKVIGAVIIQADTIMNELITVSNHSNRLIWAKQAFQDPDGKAGEMFPALIGANNAATVSNIVGASDSAIINAVGNSVDIFADGT
jgi:hypothetical protein